MGSHEQAVIGLASQAVSINHQSVTIFSKACNKFYLFSRTRKETDIVDFLASYCSPRQNFLDWLSALYGLGCEKICLSGF